MTNKQIVKKYLNRYFKAQYLTEDDTEFKSLVRILNKKDRRLSPELEAELLQKREEILKDERLSYKTAIIQTNAPLALIQLSMAVKLETIESVLGPKERLFE